MAFCQRGMWERDGVWVSIKDPLQGVINPLSFFLNP